MLVIQNNIFKTFYLAYDTKTQDIITLLSISNIIMMSKYQLHSQVTIVFCCKSVYDLY